MAKHIIGLEELNKSMKTEIVIASSYDSRTKKAKDIKFTPYDLTYRVRFYDGHSETSNSYKHPQDAIDKYNKCYLFFQYMDRLKSP